MRPTLRTLLLTALAMAPVLGCGAASGPADDDDDDVGLPGEACDADEPDLVRPDGWGLDSHCKGADADYDLLFDDTVVHRIDIEVSEEDYVATMEDLEEILDSGGGPGGPGGADVDVEPMWVPVTVRFDGLTWWQVGMRYKGNSSLRSAFTEGVRKLPFRLSFDKYEDDNPELLNQRFFGFKKMTFSSGFKDESLIRDKVAADVFREAGVPAARGAFAAIFVDHGEGPVYFGLYAMIEDPSNKMLDSQFDDDSGNLYKPDGDGATLSTFDVESLPAKTNENVTDHSDAQALIAALNGDRDDAEAWREELEAVFDVDSFLTLLAHNQAMVNWDSYGWMTHNYYLYSDPSDGGRFVWIPWDLNEAMLEPPGGGGPGGPGGMSSADSVLLDEIEQEWPMIRFVLDDPVYAAQYRAELEAALIGAFEAGALEEKMSRYHDLIEPWVVGANGESSPYTNLGSANDFDGSLTGSGGLFDHVDDRHEAVAQALGL
jgi:spore coat protein H